LPVSLKSNSLALGDFSVWKDFPDQLTLFLINHQRRPVLSAKPTARRLFRPFQLHLLLLPPLIHFVYGFFVESPNSSNPDSGFLF